MNLESQVCSFELSKKLKELGIKQDSYFYYWSCEDKNCDCSEKIQLKDGEPENLIGYSAFTVAELGEILFSIGFKMYPPRKENETEADTRAKLIIDLKDR